MTSLVFAIIGIILTALYSYLTWNYNFWIKQGVDSVPKTIPGLGNVTRAILLKENVGTMCNRFYKMAKNSSMIGFFFLRTPALLVKDPELVKTILVTNFHNFRVNMFQITEKDRLLMQDAFFTRDEAWKVSRTRMSNMFSSKKLRIFFDIMHGVGNRLQEFVDRKIKENGNVYEVKLEELFSRFTGEVAANAGYGIEGQCFDDIPKPNSFAGVANKVFNTMVIQGFGQTLLFYVPKLASFLGFSFVSKKVEHFFIDIAKSIMESTKKNAYNKHNVAHFTLDTLESPDLIVMAGQLMSFFVDTYITSSIAASLTAYRLAEHYPIQHRTREEILKILKNNNEILSYDAINQMTYLDQVVNESLRIHAPASFLMKYCTNECSLTGFDGQSCTVKPGTVIFIPIQNLQTDEKYWPDPKTFDPDRFHSGRKNDIVKYTYLPFGEGPRTCVGIRLAILQVKVILVTILRNYSMEISSKTNNPLELDPYSTLANVKGGLWAKLRKL